MFELINTMVMWIFWLFVLMIALWCVNLVNVHKKCEREKKFYEKWNK